MENLNPTPGTIAWADKEIWYELEYAYDGEWYTSGSADSADTEQAIRRKLDGKNVDERTREFTWRAVRKTLTTEVL